MLVKIQKQLVHEFEQIKQLKYCLPLIRTTVATILFLLVLCSTAHFAQSATYYVFKYEWDLQMRPQVNLVLL